MSHIQGGCYCGAVRYRITQPFLAVAACHCRKCQYGSGGGPNHAVLVAREAFELTSGTPVEHVSSADSGAEVVRAFCGACGTPLYSDSPNLPVRPVRIGSLDDPSVGAPSVHVWTEAAPAWHAFVPGAQLFMRAPAGL